jgi:hypothetical protein
MEYAVEIALGATMYIPNFVKTVSVIQNLIRGGGYTDMFIP